jgi:hypothetical protein
LRWWLKRAVEYGGYLRGFFKFGVKHHFSRPAY